MSETETTGRNSKENSRRTFLAVLSNTFIRLKPRRQLEIPALFVFWVATLGITFLSIYLWIFHGFKAVPMQSLLTLWILVFFVNVCESYAETGEDNNIADDIPTMNRSAKK
ncbi:MAG: hypothetical protein WCO63_06435 [Bacteroidota bacterium]